MWRGMVVRSRHGQQRPEKSPLVFTLYRLIIIIIIIIACFILWRIKILNENIELNCDESRAVDK